MTRHESDWHSQLESAIRDLERRAVASDLLAFEVSEMPEPSRLEREAMTTLTGDLRKAASELRAIFYNQPKS